MTADNKEAFLYIRDDNLFKFQRQILSTHFKVDRKQVVILFIEIPTFIILFILLLLFQILCPHSILCFFILVLNSY